MKFNPEIKNASKIGKLLLRCIFFALSPYLLMSFSDLIRGDGSSAVGLGLLIVVTFPLAFVIFLCGFVIYVFDLRRTSLQTVELMPASQPDRLRSSGALRRIGILGVLFYLLVFICIKFIF